jgi:hypothetical protein
MGSPLKAFVGLTRAYFVARAAEAVQARGVARGRTHGNPHRAHRLLVRAAAGAGDPGHGDGAVGRGRSRCASGQLARDGFAHGAVLRDSTGGHSQQPLLQSVGVGHDATDEVVAGAGHCSDALRDHAAGTALGERQGEAARAQRLAEHGGQVVGAVAVAPLADALTQDALALVEGERGLRGVQLAPAGQAQVFADARREERERQGEAAQRGAAGGVRLQDVGEPLLDGRLRDARGAQRTADDRLGRTEARDQAGQHLVLDERAHLAGDTGKQDGGAERLVLEHEPGRGAAPVPQQSRAPRNECLVPVDGRHRDASHLEATPHLLQPILVQLERGAVQRGHDRLREVVVGGAEAAGADHGAAARQGSAHRLADGSLVVGDRGAARDAQPGVGQAGPEPCAVGVDGGAEQELGADGDDLDHGGRAPAQRARSCLRHPRR